MYPTMSCRKKLGERVVVIKLLLLSRVRVMPG